MGVYIAGLAFGFLFAFADDGISIIREYFRLRYMQWVIASLPNEERGEFVQRYLNDPAALNKKFAAID